MRLVAMLIGVVLITATLAGCSDDNVKTCPQAKPDDGAACSTKVTTVDHCRYKIQSCPNGPDIEWACTCLHEKWACTRGTECATQNWEAFVPKKDAGKKGDGPKGGDGKKPSDAKGEKTVKPPDQAQPKPEATVPGPG